MHATRCLAMVVVAALLPRGQADAEPLEAKSVFIRLIEEVDVPARDEGLLGEVKAREGQRVSAGTLLARIDDVEVRLGEQRAKQELAIARRRAENDVSIRFAGKTLEVRKAELKRAGESLEKFKRSISQTEMDRLRLAVEESTLEVEQSKHNRELEQLNLGLKETEYQFALEKVRRRRILSPTDGVVVEVYAQRGEWVEPGQKVMRVVRMDRLRAEGFLKLRDSSVELTGRPAKITVDLPGEAAASFSGRVVFVSPEIDAVNGEVRVWAEVDNPQLKLRPGMSARMTIDLP